MEELLKDSAFEDVKENLNISITYTKPAITQFITLLFIRIST